jgi:hypothetical protein
MQNDVPQNNAADEVRDGEPPRPSLLILVFGGR